MKKSVITSLILLLASSGAVMAADSLDLEPCINGGVSATGAYSSQAEEDAALAVINEPCINAEQV